MSEPTKLVAAPRAIERNFGVESFKFNRWSLELEETSKFDDVLVPSFWAHLAEKIMGHDKTNPRGRGDVLVLRQISTGLYAELIVLEIGVGFVKVAPIRAYEPKDVPISDASPLATRWNPGKKKHEVIRRSDNQVMQGDFQSKESAAAWLADHLRSMAA